MSALGGVSVSVASENTGTEKAFISVPVKFLKTERIVFGLEEHEADPKLDEQSWPCFLLLHQGQWPP